MAAVLWMVSLNGVAMSASMNGVEMHRDSEQACGPHERWWEEGGICVDKGMKDSWLLRMNSLAVFKDDVRSCEGISKGNASGCLYGRPYFRAETCASGIISKYSTALKHAGTFNELLSKHFGKTHNTVGLCPDQNMESLMLKLECPTLRTTATMPDEISNWFEKITIALKPFEREFLEWSEQ